MPKLPVGGDDVLLASHAVNDGTMVFLWKVSVLVVKPISDLSPQCRSRADNLTPKYGASACSSYELFDRITASA